jgi:hypothetical protein
MILRRMAFACGMALTWTCAVFGWSLLTAPICTGNRTGLARHRVIEIRDGITQYALDHNRCPIGNADLIYERYVNRQGMVDPWGTVFAFTCRGGDPIVRSAGPDRLFDTADDITSD